MVTNVMQADVRNLCEEVVLLWGMAANATEKRDLANTFSAVTYSMAVQIRSQPSVIPINGQTNNTFKMFSTLNNLDPGYYKLTGCSKLFREEAARLKLQASLQLNFLPQNALNNGADVLTYMADASRPPPAQPKPKAVVPPAPEPEPVVLPKEASARFAW